MVGLELCALFEAHELRRWYNGQLAQYSLHASDIQAMLMEGSYLVFSPVTLPRTHFHSASNRLTHTAISDMSTPFAEAYTPHSGRYRRDDAIVWVLDSAFLDNCSTTPADSIRLVLKIGVAQQKKSILYASLKRYRAPTTAMLGSSTCPRGLAWVGSHSLVYVPCETVYVDA